MGAGVLTIVTWLWRGERDYRAEHAAVLARMLGRHLSIPHRLVVIADADIDGDFGAAEVVRTPAAAQALAELRTPEGERFPSSYRRLWLFSAEARALGERVLLTDVDVVVTGDWAALAARDEDFVGWCPIQSWGKGHRIAGGMWLLRTGTRTEVWERFAGRDSIVEARKAGYRGSDQAWISHCLAADAATWPRYAGIYSIRDMTWARNRTRTDAPPEDAVAVHWNGAAKPWDAVTQELHPWVAEAWR